MADKDRHGVTLHEEQGGAGAVAQSVKCLPCKYEDPSSDPHNAFKKPSMAQHSWDSQRWGGWDGRIHGAWWPDTLAGGWVQDFSERLSRARACTHTLTFVHIWILYAHTHEHWENDDVPSSQGLLLVFVTCGPRVMLPMELWVYGRVTMSFLIFTLLIPLGTSYKCVLLTLQTWVLPVFPSQPAALSPLLYPSQSSLWKWSLILWAESSWVPGTCICWGRHRLQAGIGPYRIGDQRRTEVLALKCKT